jgi:inner membrane protein involved in colicin E2 resistance
MTPEITGRRLLAILFIFACAAVAWFTLGASLVHRSGASSRQLSAEVGRLWGGVHRQQGPRVWWVESKTVLEDVVQETSESDRLARPIERSVETSHPLPLDSSMVTVDLDLEHRRKGLLWYDVYTVSFAGHYRVRAPEAGASRLRLQFTFPATDAMYDAFRVRIGDHEATPTAAIAEGLMVEIDAQPGEVLPIEVAYHSRGLDRWSYSFQESGVAQVRDFQLALTTDFADIDFPDGGLSPTAKSATDDGWKLTWAFDSLVTGKQIGLDLPNRLNPGPLAARITFFAPVSLLFFFTVLVIVGILRRRNLHPMHYFFLSAAFFAFHLLLAYLVDHLDIHAAFAIAAAVSVFLVVSYLRLVGGDRLAFRQAGLAQLIYLVLFNYAFFFDGYTGLTVTIGAIVTLFVLMRLTAPVDWARAMAPAPAVTSESTP